MLTGFFIFVVFADIRTNSVLIQNLWAMPRKKDEMATKKSAVEQLATITAEFEAAKAKVKEEALTELNKDLEEAQAKVHEISAQISELTGKPIKEATERKGRMRKAAKEIAVKKLYEAIGRKKDEAKSAGELMQAIGLEKSSWQSVSKEIIGLTKIGDKKDAKWYVKA